MILSIIEIISMTGIVLQDWYNPSTPGGAIDNQTACTGPNQWDTYTDCKDKVAGKMVKSIRLSDLSRWTSTNPPPPKAQYFLPI